MKLRTRVLATLLVTALTLAGCGNAAKHGDADTSSSNSSESKGSDQLIIGAETDVVTLDPGRCYETYANTLMREHAMIHCLICRLDRKSRSLFWRKIFSILMMDLL